MNSWRIISSISAISVLFMTADFMQQIQKEYNIKSLFVFLILQPKGTDFFHPSTCKKYSEAFSLRHRSYLVENYKHLILGGILPPPDPRIKCLPCTESCYRNLDSHKLINVYICPIFGTIFEILKSNLLDKMKD